MLPDYQVCGKFSNGFHFRDRARQDELSFDVLPTGIIYQNCTCLIGNGVLVHFPTLLEEVKRVQGMGISIKDRLFIGNG